MNIYDVKSYKRRRIRRIFGKTRENEETKKNRLEMSVQMGTTLSRLTGITLGCVVYQKTSGLPIVGDS